jgi:ferredoxin
MHYPYLHKNKKNKQQQQQQNRNEMMQHDAAHALRTCPTTATTTKPKRNDAT